jgi:predicted nucleotidyltransferase
MTQEVTASFYSCSNDSLRMESLTMCKMVPYKNGRCVADIKLRHIDNISAQAKDAKNIHRIMLFGSALEERCTERSDIDIAVFGRKAKNSYIDSREFREFKKGLFSFDWNQDYDVLYFREGEDHSAAIMEDISRGVEIFRRTPEWN